MTRELIYRRTSTIASKCTAPSSARACPEAALQPAAAPMDKVAARALLLRVPRARHSQRAVRPTVRLQPDHRRPLTRLVHPAACRKVAPRAPTPAAAAA